MPMLTNGTVIKTSLGETVKVKEYIAEGGQGEVYKVIHQGKERALKWYLKSSLNGDNSNPQFFYNNIKANASKGKPSDEFLWPIDVTEWQDGTFGYVMELRPAGYHNITDFMNLVVRFNSYRAIINACLKIVFAFRILHNNGYSYQDLNDGNFFINPENGRVLICDNDNVAIEGTKTGILGKSRYMAPEIVLGKNKPDSLSDRFSMAILIYILFCLDHPLEGKRSLLPNSPELTTKLYGSEPLFIMDPKDKSNGPVPGTHDNSLMVWKCLPKYMQDIFIKAFSKESFENPKARPKEIDWLKVLTRFRSEIVPCSCGNEVFTQNGNSTKCDKCGKIVKVPFKLIFRDYATPAIKDSRIYKCQLGVYNVEEALDPIASVVSKKDSDSLGIRNKTSKTWNALTPSGKSKKVAPDEAIPLKNGITFTIDDMTIKIEENK